MYNCLINIFFKWTHTHTKPYQTEQQLVFYFCWAALFPCSIFFLFSCWDISSPLVSSPDIHFPLFLSLLSVFSRRHFIFFFPFAFLLEIFFFLLRYSVVMLLGGWWCDIISVCFCSCCRCFEKIFLIFYGIQLNTYACKMHVYRNYMSIIYRL